MFLRAVLLFWTCSKWKQEHVNTSYDIKISRTEKFQADEAWNEDLLSIYTLCEFCEIGYRLRGSVVFSKYLFIILISFEKLTVTIWDVAFPESLQACLLNAWSNISFDVTFSVKTEALAMDKGAEGKDLRSNPPTKVKLPSFNKPSPPPVKDKPHKVLPK